MTRTIRVFPRRTRATPRDPLAYVGPPDLFADADRVEISVAFTWDLDAAHRLARAWERVAPVAIGGPATRQRSADFTPGRYLRPGYTITSRGCPHRCPFCPVPDREGPPRELPIRPGWIVQDDNLLACTEAHVRAVFAMLARQPLRAVFAGGLQARRLADWHVDLLASLAPRPVVFTAYDRREDLDAVRDAGRRLLAAGFTTASHRLRCYVFCGYPGDALDAADRRMREALDAGFTPMAMAWREPSTGALDADWQHLQRTWARPALIHARRDRLGQPGVTELRPPA